MSLETNTLAYRASIFHCKIAVVIIQFLIGLAKTSLVALLSGLWLLFCRLMGPLNWLLNIAKLQWAYISSSLVAEIYWHQAGTFICMYIVACRRWHAPLNVCNRQQFCEPMCTLYYGVYLYVLHVHSRVHMCLSCVGTTESDVTWRTSMQTLLTRIRYVQCKCVYHNWPANSFYVLGNNRRILRSPACLAM